MSIFLCTRPGGDGNWRHYLTLPNILKVFNPRLRGFSNGVRKLGLGGTSRRQPRNSYRVDYNFAETGADSDDIIGQARRLVKRMKADKHVDFKR